MLCFGKLPLRLEANLELLATFLSLLNMQLACFLYRLGSRIWRIRRGFHLRLSSGVRSFCKRIKIFYEREFLAGMGFFMR